MKRFAASSNSSAATWRADWGDEAVLWQIAHSLPFPRELIAIIWNELSGRGRINFGADILIRHFSYSFPIRGNLRQIELTQLADRIALDLVRFPIKDGPALFQWVKQRQIDNSFQTSVLVH